MQVTRQPLACGTVKRTAEHEIGGDSSGSPWATSLQGDLQQANGVVAQANADVGAYKQTVQRLQAQLAEQEVQQIILHADHEELSRELQYMRVAHTHVSQKECSSNLELQEMQAVAAAILDETEAVKMILGDLHGRGLGARSSILFLVP